MGFIAEEKTDVAALTTLARGITKDESFPIRSVSDSGCSNIRLKSTAWMADLAAKGCTHIVIVHDCDRWNEDELRKVLEKHEPPDGVEHLICIPVEELEAWFWSDRKVLQKVAGRNGKLPRYRAPHLIKSPKEELERLSRRGRTHPSYSVNDNGNLAKLLDHEVCARACPAFHRFREFLLKDFAASA